MHMGFTCEIARALRWLVEQGPRFKPSPEEVCIHLSVSLALSSQLPSNILCITCLKVIALSHVPYDFYLVC